MFGTYPEIGLKDARRKRDDARRLLADGIDPGAEKKRAMLEAAITASNTFSLIRDSSAINYEA
jgi:hypothetical protein